MKNSIERTYDFSRLKIKGSPLNQPVDPPGLNNLNQTTPPSTGWPQQKKEKREMRPFEPSDFWPNGRMTGWWVRESTAAQSRWRSSVKPTLQLQHTQAAHTAHSIDTLQLHTVLYCTLLSSPLLSSPMTCPSARMASNYLIKHLTAQDRQSYLRPPNRFDNVRWSRP